MSDTPPEFDLKFLPAWLKEGPDTQKYANYEAPRERSGGDRGFGGPRPGGARPGGPRPGGPGGGRGPGGPSNRDSRGPRPSGPGAPNRGPRRDGPAGGMRERDPRRDEREREPRPLPPPAQVRIEFLPDPNGALSIAKQIKQSGRAYPLFGTGRLFLERPERHRVRITSQDANVPLFQFGDGPISFDRAAVERTAFFTARSEYYKEEIVEGEPIKGNFKNVARLRGAGPFLGPTNYHSYQPALRRMYEERYARRMSFAEFTQSEVQVLTDEQSINDWKEQARSTTTYVTLQEETPITFKTVPEVEAHFRQQYLPQLVRSGTTLECSGQASRELPDRSISYGVRDGWERERGFPVNLVNHLRPYFMEAGLHFFKHRKRILYISAIKPLRYVTGQAISSGIEAILKAVEEHPRCARRDLALRILGENADAPEQAEAKAALARDFHYLAHAGHVIEFHDGAIDLPLPPGGLAALKGAGKPGRAEDSPEAERDAEQAALAEAQPRQGAGKRTEPPRRNEERAPRGPRPAMADAPVAVPATGTAEGAGTSLAAGLASEETSGEVNSEAKLSASAPEGGAPEETSTDNDQETSLNAGHELGEALEEPQFTANAPELIAGEEGSLSSGKHTGAQQVTTTVETVHYSSFEQLAQSMSGTATSGEVLPLTAEMEHTQVVQSLEPPAEGADDQPLPSVEFLQEEAPMMEVPAVEIVQLSTTPEPVSTDQS